MSKVYIETSVPSYLTARSNKDIRVTANQNSTKEWWDTQRTYFDLFISEFVLAEAGLGDPKAAEKRLAAISEIPVLMATDDVKILARALINRGSIPSKAELDAYHIAIAAVNGVDYLLTWNCTHIANAVMRPKIESICRQLGFEPPIICTPLELMEN